MKKHRIELSKTGQFSSFFLDYIQGKEELKPFYSHSPKIESFKDAISAKSFSPQKREVLVNALTRQFQGVELTELAEQNLSSLLKPNTFTVTTGHQLNLFTGPLYFIYKIVSTINLAKSLQKAYPDCQFVPVYWMATEDHDFEEINYFKLDGKKYQWQSTQTGAVGDFELDATFKEFMKSVSFAPDFFKKAYSESKTLSEAVRKYVNELFGKEGLLVVDGNDSSLKGLFRDVILSDSIHPVFAGNSTLYTREYFEISLEFSRSAETCAELARLLAQLGDTESSNRLFQQGVVLLQAVAQRRQRPAILFLT